jgi:hypothetical protein
MQEKRENRSPGGHRRHVRLDRLVSAVRADKYLVGAYPPEWPPREPVRTGVPEGSPGGGW